jgi:hypothetical protein
MCWRYALHWINVVGTSGMLGICSNSSMYRIHARVAKADILLFQVFSTKEFSFSPLDKPIIVRCSSTMRTKCNK